MFQTLPHSLFASLLLLCAAPAAAQSLLMRSSTAPTLGEAAGAGFAPPAPPVPYNPYTWFGFVINPSPGIPPFPLVPPPTPAHLATATPFPFGDLAVDNLRGLVVETDGDSIAIWTHPTFLPAGAPPNVTITPRTPWLPGRLTGIAVDPQTQLLWCTDGTWLQATSTTAPTTPQTLTVPFGFPVLAPPMTGLDWDPVGGHLIGCDAAGNVYRFAGHGAPVGPQPWIAGLQLGAGNEATDVAVPHLPTSLYYSAKAFLQSRNSGVWGHYHDGTWGAPLSFDPLFLSLPGTEAGLALLYDVERRLIDCGCPHGMFAPTAPTVIGQAQGGFVLRDLPPGTPAFLLFDLSLVTPTGGLPACFGHIALPLTPLVSQLAFAGNDGRAVFSLPMMVHPMWAGLECFAQTAFLCQGPQPIGVSSLLRMQLGMP